jgi:hypothetical protein
LPLKVSLNSLSFTFTIAMVSLFCFTKIIFILIIEIKIP